jgi:hypothetical protein
MMHVMAIAKPLLWPIKCREVASGKLLNCIWYVHFRSPSYLIGLIFSAFRRASFLPSLQECQMELRLLIDNLRVTTHYQSPA